MNRVHILSRFLRRFSGAVVFSVLMFAGNGMAAPALPRLPALGPELEGVWDGLLQSGSGTMPVTFSIITADGKSTVSLDIMEQAARDIPVAATRDGAKVHFDAGAVDGAFDGTLASDGGLQGSWVQAGKRIPLNLKRRTPQ